jgi:ribulose-bisphosphate carboxylase small chain
MALHDNMGDFKTAHTLETFGFLPKLTQEEIYEQIDYLIAQGWTPAIEHEHPANSANPYWTMWKLPFFGETVLENVVAELEACRRAYPDHHIRLLGYDNYTQSQGTCFVAYEGQK